MGEPLQELRRAALLDRRAAVDDQVLAEPERVGLRSLDRDRHARVPADVAQLLLLAQVRGDDVVAVEADPDDRDLRAPVRIDRDEVGEPVGLEHRSRALGKNAHRPLHSTLEQAELQDPRRVEAFDPEQLTGGLDRRARRHEPHELATRDLDPARLRLGGDPADDGVQRRPPPSR